MLIVQYFKPSSTLQTRSELGIGAVTTDEANAAVQKELDRQSSKCWKSARYMLLSLTKLVQKPENTLPEMGMQQPRESFAQTFTI